MQEGTSRPQHRTHRGLSVAMFRNRNSDPGHWLLRGIQSAIFYYVSCTPCIEARHKRRRRREARADQSRIVSTEPGFVRQPMAFETNEQWTEEILLGPGPPEGWKGDSIYRNFRKATKKGPSSPTTVPTTATSDSDTPTKPGADRRFSNALDNVKESLKNSLLPERWNWKTHDREDEILVRISDKMNHAGDKVSRMWDRVTSATYSEDTRWMRKRSLTSDSEQYDYTRGKIPPLNNLHPPVVSQLPATKEEAAWILLPPPSAAVMAGREKPTADMAYRVPLCIVGQPVRPSKENESPPSDEDREQAEYGAGAMSDSAWEPDTQSDQDEAVWNSRTRHQSEPTPLTRRPLQSLQAANLFLPSIRAPEPSLYLPKSRAIALDGIAMDLFTRPDFSSSGTATPKSRPSSWQFHYIIPSQ
ncbi:hypothetical protein DV738_g3659, partial [Chaetothyriales sp. CBS 135597]